ncbi:putative endo xylanase [Sarocladium strictum]
MAQQSTGETFSQPPIFQDLPDQDLIRIDDVYYLSSSNFSFSPCAPILRSYDLINWEYLSHSVPAFEFDNDPKFDLIGGNAYHGGVYASSLRYNEKHGKFYWIGCMQRNMKTYIYSATNIEGPWEKASTIADYSLYDCGLLVDDDGTMYVASGKWVPNGAEAQTWIAKLDDNLQVERQESVFTSNEELGYIEGARFYKVNGTYYLWLTNPGVGRGQIIVKSSGDVWGPYDSWHRVLANNGSPVEGGGPPHQGAFVDTPDGKYWYMAFVELGTSGRIPAIAPMTWDENGWPNVDLDENGHWKRTYECPLPRREVEPLERAFDFKDSKLSPRFEWNHNPDNTKWSIGDGLKLQTATVTDDFFAARNTLTHRIVGPESSVTVELDISGMRDGDRAGLATMRFDAGWIGVVREGSETKVQMVDHIELDPKESWRGPNTGTRYPRADSEWYTKNLGEVIASEAISGDKIWLRCHIVAKAVDRSTFSYSLDGKRFEVLGQVHQTIEGVQWFTGSRHGLFNFATKEVGGHVVVKSFEISMV